MSHLQPGILELLGERAGKVGVGKALRPGGQEPLYPLLVGRVPDDRVQQTLKNWLAAQPIQPSTLVELQALLDAFVADYNHHRPHRSLPGRATPAVAYQARPKATPAARLDTHDRIDTDGKVTLGVNGRLHHIGIGRTHARTPVLLLVHDLQVRVVNAATGELLRELVIDPARNHQPIHPPPTKDNITPNPTEGSG